MREARRRWLSVSAYARAYGIDRSTVYKWLASGLVPMYRVGRVIRLKDTPPPTTPSTKR